MKIICKGCNLTDDSMKIYRSIDKIIIDGLPIADSNTPRLPYDYFIELISRIVDNQALEDSFLKILEYNIFSRRSMIKESVSTTNKVLNMFCEVMAYENNLISSGNSGCMSH